MLREKGIAHGTAEGFQMFVGDWFVPGVRMIVPHERGRADLPVGLDARQRVPTSVQKFNARRLAWEKSLPRPHSRGYGLAIRGESLDEVVGAHAIRAFV